jgi:hypothetical protein
MARSVNPEWLLSQKEAALVSVGRDRKRNLARA